MLCNTVPKGSQPETVLLTEPNNRMEDSAHTKIVFFSQRLSDRHRVCLAHAPVQAGGSAATPTSEQQCAQSIAPAYYTMHWPWVLFAQVMFVVRCVFYGSIQLVSQTGQAAQD